MTQIGILHVLPLLVLLAPLLLGRYVGEEKVSRLRERFAAAPAEHARAARAPYRRPVAPRTLMPRGGRLLGASLAVRPPPALRAAQL